MSKPWKRWPQVQDGALVCGCGTEFRFAPNAEVEQFVCGVCYTAHYPDGSAAKREDEDGDLQARVDAVMAESAPEPVHPDAGVEPAIEEVAPPVEKVSKVAKPKPEKKSKPKPPVKHK